MSKLADAIRRSQRVESTPMGFGAARPAPKPTLLVGFRGASAATAAAKEAGADLLLVEIDAPDAARAAELRSAAGDLPAGLAAKSLAPGGTKALREAGVDFLAFDAETTPASALLDDDMGYVLHLPSAPEELFLRSLEPLSLEAVDLGRIELPLTVARQLELMRVAGLSHKPLICQVAPDASSDDLQCLRAAGVVVLLLDNAQGIGKLKEAVAALPARRQRREDRAVVSLPRSQAPAEEEDDDDEP